MTQGWWTALATGAVGAVALTTLHETARRSGVPYAPRMDVLGMRALRRLPPFMHERPRSARLRRWALAGDLLANALYYSAVVGPTARSTWTRAAAAGLAAGAGAVRLPPRLGLGEAPVAHRLANQVMTVAWYVAGALAAAAAANGIRYGRLRQ